MEWDNNSSSLNNDADEGEQRWAGAMENADVRRAAKAERKVAKNQVRFDVITKEDLQVIQEALHPPPKLPTEETDLILNGQGLADNSTIDENIIFNPHTFTWAKLRERIREKKIAKNNGIKQQAPNTPQRIEELLSPIFASLCISPDLSKASRCRKSLDAKLRVAILKDITAFENEQAETMQRMAGYWRYVNRRTYNSMVRNNELWDWATGEKLPEIAEAELEAIDGEDESGAGILDEKRREGPTPEEYDPDFELPRGLKPLTLAPPVGRLEDAIHVKNLSFNPGQSPGPTLAFNVPSPSPSDEDGEVAWDNLNNPIGYSTATHNPFPLPLPLPNGNASDRDFQGVKDTRLLGKAIRPASPPREDASPSPQPPLERRPLPLVTTPEPDRTMNRFDPLDHETPAPCEEDRKSKAKPATTTAFKLHPTPIVKTLAIHDDPAWTVQQHAKGNRPGTHRGWRTPVGGNYKQPRKTATGGKL